MILSRAHGCGGVATTVGPPRQLRHRVHDPRCRPCDIPLAAGHDDGCGEGYRRVDVLLAGVNELQGLKLLRLHVARCTNKIKKAICYFNCTFR